MDIVPLGDTPARHASTRPDDLAMVFPDGRLTWAEFDRRTNLWARQFISAGLERDDLVTVALPNTILFGETVFGLWKAGAIPHIVSPKLPAGELQAILDLARPRFMIGTNGRPPAGLTVLSSQTEPEDDDGPGVSGVAATYWKAMSSGGSTGRPKIIVDHQPAEIDLERPLTAMSVGMTPEMVVLIPGPLYHNAPFLFATQALAIGCRVVGMDRFDPEEFLRLVQAFQVNWVQVVPTMMHRIWSLPRAVRERYDVSSLQVVWHMAAPCPTWLKEAWIGWLGAERILELYGGTERIGSTVIRGDEWLRKPGSVGRSHGRVRALAPDGSDCPPGEVGELHFRLTGSGERPYHYIGDEVSRIRGDWESLGDLGWLDADGYVFLADRRTDLILRGGANIYPAEVEAAIEAHPGIASSAVIGLPDTDLGQRVHAIVQPGDDGLELGDLHRFLKSRLAPYKLPQSYEFWSQPLRDDAGKVRRSGLRDERIVWMESGLPFQTWIDDEPS